MIRRWDWGDAKELDSWIEYSPGRQWFESWPSPKACGLRFRISQPVGFHLVLQGGAADAQSFGGVRNVAARFD